VRPGRDADPSPPSSADVKIRVELYLYSKGLCGLWKGETYQLQTADSCQSGSISCDRIVTVPVCSQDVACSTYQKKQKLNNTRVQR